MYISIYIYIIILNIMKSSIIKKNHLLFLFYDNKVNNIGILQIDSQTLLYYMLYFLPRQQYNHIFTSIKIDSIVFEDINLNLINPFYFIILY